MTLSIEESIQKLKAEIIAQDWRLSPTRAEQLEAAFSCLQQRFKNRKATHAMLVMAGSVLEYIRKRGGSPPETIDFLKEAMAHVVGLYEDLAYEPEKEDKIFRSLFSRFNKLKNKIKAHKKGEVLPKQTAAEALLPDASEDPGSAAAPAPAHDPAPAPVIDTEESAPDAAPPAEEAPQPLQEHPPEIASSTDVKKLIDDLKLSLDKAGQVGTAIGQVLGELLHETTTAAKPAAEAPPAQRDPEPPSTPEAIPLQETAPPPEPVQPRQRIKNCPATELTLFSINDTRIAVVSSSISLTRVIKKAKIKTYIKNSNLPLKDLAGFLQKISSLVSGNLAKIKERKLKKLHLPLMVPQGLGLPETPDENADSLLIISNGNWHGVIACSDIEKASSMMIKFEKQMNGDIAGTGYLEDDTRVQLMDSMSILRREGFLLMA